MQKLRINPFIVEDLKSINDYISEDNPDMAQVVISNIYDQFEPILKFPNIYLNCVIASCENYALKIGSR
jgi:plasmid stabilization system protein ParE